MEDSSEGPEADKTNIVAVSESHEPSEELTLPVPSNPQGPPPHNIISEESELTLPVPSNSGPLPSPEYVERPVYNSPQVSAIYHSTGRLGLTSTQKKPKLEIRHTMGGVGVSGGQSVMQQVYGGIGDHNNSSSLQQQQVQENSQQQDSQQLQDHLSESQQLQEPCQNDDSAATPKTQESYNSNINSNRLLDRSTMEDFVLHGVEDVDEEGPTVVPGTSPADIELLESVQQQQQPQLQQAQQQQFSRTGTSSLQIETANISSTTNPNPQPQSPRRDPDSPSTGTTSQTQTASQKLVITTPASHNCVSYSNPPIGMFKSVKNNAGAEDGSSSSSSQESSQILSQLSQTSKSLSQSMSQSISMSQTQSQVSNQGNLNQGTNSKVLSMEGSAGTQQKLKGIGSPRQQQQQLQTVLSKESVPGSGVLQLAGSNLSSKRSSQPSNNSPKGLNTATVQRAFSTGSERSTPKMKNAATAGQQNQQNKSQIIKQLLQNQSQNLSPTGSGSNDSNQGSSTLLTQPLSPFDNINVGVVQSHNRSTSELNNPTPPDSQSDNEIERSLTSTSIEQQIQNQNQIYIEQQQRQEQSQSQTRSLSMSSPGNSVENNNVTSTSTTPTDSNQKMNDPLNNTQLQQNQLNQSINGPESSQGQLGQSISQLSTSQLSQAQSQQSNTNSPSRYGHIKQNLAAGNVVRSPQEASKHGGIVSGLKRMFSGNKLSQTQQSQTSDSQQNQQNSSTMSTTSSYQTKTKSTISKILGLNNNSQYAPKQKSSQKKMAEEKMIQQQQQQLNAQQQLQPQPQLLANGVTQYPNDTDVQFKLEQTVSYPTNINSISDPSVLSAEQQNLLDQKSNSVDVNSPPRSPSSKASAPHPGPAAKKKARNFHSIFDSPTKHSSVTSRGPGRSQQQTNNNLTTSANTKVGSSNNMPTVANYFGSRNLILESRRRHEDVLAQEMSQWGNQGYDVHGNIIQGNGQQQVNQQDAANNQNQNNQSITKTSSQPEPSGSQSGLEDQQQYTESKESNNSSIIDGINQMSTNQYQIQPKSHSANDSNANTNITPLIQQPNLNNPGLRNGVNSLIRPYVIGVCGATCSGKTTLCNIFRQELKNYLRVAFIPSDSFYKDLSDADKILAAKSQYNFDHPDAIDWGELLQILKTLKQGYKSVELPKYDFVTHSRLKKEVQNGPDGKQQYTFGSTSGGEIIRPADVIIVEGILIYSVGPDLRSEMDLKIFIDCDSDIRLARRLQRDIAERGRDFQSIMNQYMSHVKPSYENFIEPSKRYADIVIPNTKESEMSSNNAISMMVQFIKHQLEKRNSARRLTRGIQ